MMPRNSGEPVRLQEPQAVLTPLKAAHGSLRIGPL
jgi:hypothetical protein